MLSINTQLQSLVRCHAGKPPCLVSVPTHFYKVVLAETKSRIPFGGNKVSVGAFVMPNDQIQPDMPLTAFAVPLEMLENVAGMTIFMALLTPLCSTGLRTIIVRMTDCLSV